MAQETGRNINMISNSFQNTWRNLMFAAVCGSVVIGGAVYLFHRELYSRVIISNTQTSTLVLTTAAGEVKGIKEYRPYVIGGDVVPELRIPRKRDMFIPFDLRLISAAGVLVKDVETGEVLFGNNEYTIRPLASLTKLMTALVLEEEIADWDILATTPDDTIYDSHIFAHESGTLDHWFEVGLVGSSNRAILTLVDASRKSREEFVARMNEKAQELGMLETEFTDPTGIDPGNISTPSDIALLLVEALNNGHITSTLTLHTVQHEVVKKNTTIQSTNWLLTGWIKSDFVEPIIGKTGYIAESDYNFVGKFSKDKNRHIMVVILGSKDLESRFTDALALANWTFANYEWVNL